jgi:predicted nucleotidyltransferase component of viral defense system
VQDLIAQERLEMEVLDKLHRERLLQGFYFCGGTMLRLCHGLDRYSVDLDFWLADHLQADPVFREMERCLSSGYQLKDAAEKRFTMVFELRASRFPRSLKIEIRKDHPPAETETAIAYSPHANRQVMLRALTLRAMMELKTVALLDRGEIRDAYDMEFLVKRGICPQADVDSLRQVLARIADFRKTDYTAKLGSLISPELRPYYRDQNFRILKAAIEARLGLPRI